MILRGNDISSGSVCFGFWLNQHSAAQFKLVCLLRSENDLKRQPVTEPQPMSLPLNHLPYYELQIVYACVSLENSKNRLLHKIVNAPSNRIPPFCLVTSFSSKERKR